MNFEIWWYNNENELDFFNFEKEEAQRVWNAAIDEAIKEAQRVRDSNLGQMKPETAIILRLEKLKS